MKNAYKVSVGAVVLFLGMQTGVLGTNTDPTVDPATTGAKVQPSGRCGKCMRGTQDATKFVRNRLMPALDQGFVAFVAVSNIAVASLEIANPELGKEVKNALSVLQEVRAGIEVAKTGVVALDQASHGEVLNSLSATIQTLQDAKTKFGLDAAHSATLDKLIADAKLLNGVYEASKPVKK